MVHKKSEITHSPTAWKENDAKGCSDRIFPSVASLNCRRYGVPRVGCLTLAKIWTQLDHSIKTSNGISLTTFCALTGEYHAGAGQGSCITPLISNTISTQILHITGEVPYKTTLEHANNLDPISRQSEAYVDDTSFMVDLSHQSPQDPTTKAQVLLHHITKVAQCAEWTLYASGGAL